MAWRITDEEQVFSIMDGPEDTDSLAPFIDMGNALVNDLASEDTDGELSDTTLLQIEILVSAHFAEMLHHQYASHSELGASARFQGQFDKGLESTKYGQNALLLDRTGYLRELSKGIERGGVTWLGLPPSEQTDYVDRD